MLFLLKIVKNDDGEWQSDDYHPSREISKYGLFVISNFLLRKVLIISCEISEFW